MLHSNNQGSLTILDRSFKSMLPIIGCLLSTQQTIDDGIISMIISSVGWAIPLRLSLSTCRSLPIFSKAERKWQRSFFSHLTKALLLDGLFERIPSMWTTMSGSFESYIAKLKDYKITKQRDYKGQTTKKFKWLIDHDLRLEKSLQMMTIFFYNGMTYDHISI